MFHFNNPIVRFAIVGFAEFWSCLFFACFGFRLFWEAAKRSDCSVKERLAYVAVGVISTFIGTIIGIHMLLWLERIANSGH